jgi:hypothetical protein
VRTLVSISTLSSANDANERGKTTWEFKMPSGMQLTTYFRKRGTESGHHFHKGEDPRKNPEYIIVFLGEIIFHSEDMSGNIDQLRIAVALGEAPKVIKVEPCLFHHIEYVADTLYAEPRSTHFNPHLPDTFDRDEWKKFIGE